MSKMPFEATHRGTWNYLPLVGQDRCRCGALGAVGTTEQPIPEHLPGWHKVWCGFSGWQLLCPDCVAARLNRRKP